MTESNAPRSKASLKSIANLAIEGAATRAQILGIELSVAKDNAVKAAINAVIAVVFGLFALVFISVALLVCFWEDHRVFVSICLAVFYLVLFLVFLGRARGFSANLPFAFEETKQIITNDMIAIRNSLNSAGNKQSNGETNQNASK